MQVTVRIKDRTHNIEQWSNFELPSPIISWCYFPGERHYAWVYGFKEGLYCFYTTFIRFESILSLIYIFTLAKMKQPKQDIEM